MKLIYRLFKLNPDTREGEISAASILNIAVNVFIALAKIIAGALASSIAIVSEGVNNASDALTSVLALAGTKLASRHPDKKHPFGYGRIEYLTGLVIAVLILVTGIEMLISAVKLILHPEPLAISVISLVIVAVSAFVKFFLGLFTIKTGRKTGSSALEAVGLEGRNDAYISVVTIASALVFLVFHLSLDAYVGVFTSLIIIRAGAEVLLDTLSELLGRAGDKELADTLYREIRAADGILNAADMMLHNYGPDAYSGSVNVEIDHAKTVGEVYEILHALQLRIMHEHRVTMVFGVYAVDSEHEGMTELRKSIAEFVRGHDGVVSFHALYIDPAAKRLYCDLVADYSLRDWDALRAEFTDYMKTVCPDLSLELTIETEYV